MFAKHGVVPKQEMASNIPPKYLQANTFSTFKLLARKLALIIN